MVDQPMVTRRDQLERTGTPLRKFTGKFIGSGEDDTNMRLFPHQEENRDSMSVDLNFIDLDTDSIESISPWNYPTAQIKVNYRTSQRSGGISSGGGWGILLDSLEQFEAQGILGMEDCLGKVITMEAEPDHEFGTNRQTQEVMRGMVWRVVEVQGLSQDGAAPQVDDDTRMKQLLHGRNLTDFANRALNDPVGRKRSDDIINSRVIPAMLADGTITEDTDGRFWVTGWGKDETFN